MSAPILPGATVGLLGGGQLGRMAAQAAARLGYRVHVLAPEQDPPAAQVAALHTRAPYDDLDAVAAFARSVDVVGYEFENVPAATAEAAARHAPVRPAGSVLAATQDRLRERALLDRLGLPCAPHAGVHDEASLEAALEQVGLPAVLKTATDGYDGKGQRRLSSPAEARAAWDELQRQPCLLEARVSFVRELSVVMARGLDGELALYDPFENEHVRHVLDLTLSPAELAAPRRAAALELARGLAEGLELVGVACVELFELEDGGLLVNEIAPRPHNSGHVTLDAHVSDQFEQQVRALCGLPLGSTALRAPAAAMANLLGDVWQHGEPDWSAALRHPDVHLHLYGKQAARAGRKMGHLTAVGADLSAARGLALRARAALRRAAPPTIPGEPPATLSTPSPAGRC